MSTPNKPAVSSIQPYLFFNGRCEEAAEFYARVLGAEVLMKARFSESPEPYLGATPETAEKIMHMTLRIGEATIMASDGRCTGMPKFEGFCLSLTVADHAEADQVFAGLAEGGQVEMPLGKTFWSPYFGMVTDKFDVGWMITLPTQGHAQD